MSIAKEMRMELTRHVGTLLLTVGLLAGCSSQEPAAQPAEMTPLPTATQPAAVPDTPTAAPAAPTTPAPDTQTGGAAEPAMLPDTGAAVVENIDVRIMESFPVQAQAVLTGYLPDGCTTITGIEVVEEGTTFHIHMTTERPADAACTMAVTPFEQVVSLDVAELPAGVYQLVVNDLVWDFELPGSEPAAEQPQPGAYPVVETPTGYILAQVDVPVVNAPLPDSAEIGLIAGGQMARVTGASPDGAWWRVICPDDTVGDCWVSADPAFTVPTTPPG